MRTLHTTRAGGRLARGASHFGRLRCRAGAPARLCHACPSWSPLSRPRSLSAYARPLTNHLCVQLPCLVCLGAAGRRKGLLTGTLLVCAHLPCSDGAGTAIHTSRQGGADGGASSKLLCLGGSHPGRYGAGTSSRQPPAEMHAHSVPFIQRGGPAAHLFRKADVRPPLHEAVCVAGVAGAVTSFLSGCTDALCMLCTSAELPAGYALSVQLAKSLYCRIFHRWL